MKQWASVLGCAVIVAGTHAKTDEIPVYLGLVLIFGGVLGLVFPARPWVAGFLVGIPPFLIELLAHFGVMQVPYRIPAGIPWSALVGLVPGLGAAFLGSAIRHLNPKNLVCGPVGQAFSLSTTRATPQKSEREPGV